MPAREKRRLTELEQKDAALCRNEESIIVVRRSLFFKCRYVYRPMQIVLGVSLLAVALLIFVSLLLSNINKCLHFVNFRQIFAQGNQTLPNPIDLVLSWTGKVGPERSSRLSARHACLVLSDQLYLLDGSAYLHHRHLAVWFTADWHLVLLRPSTCVGKHQTEGSFSSFEDVPILSWTHETAGTADALLADDVHRSGHQCIRLPAHSSVCDLRRSALRIHHDRKSTELASDSEGAGVFRTERSLCSLARNF